MKVEAILESGFLELYVMNQLSPEEVIIVNRLRIEHSEIDKEINQIELNLESILNTEKIDISNSNLSKIMKKLELDSNNSIQNPTITKLENKSIMNESNQLKESSFLNFKNILSMAASFLAVIFSITTFHYFKEFENAEHKLAKLDLELKKQNNQYNQLSTELVTRDVELKILYDTSYQKIVLKSTDKAIARAATIFWDNKSGSIYSNSSQLGNLPSDKQYQLWAIKAGKPIDLGLMTDTIQLQKQINIDSAEAFAITIENSGGSLVPTMDKMVVISTLK